MNNQVLFVDIDNTLYDWPNFFAPSFRVMVHVLSRELKVPEDRLYDECKAVFARHGSLEYSFVIQELDSVKSTNEARLRDLIRLGRGAFRSVQKKRLAPYHGVEETLRWLYSQDVPVIGITNSPAWRAQQRLFDLGLDKLISGLVAWEGWMASPDDANRGFVRDGQTRVRTRVQRGRLKTISEEECKPSEKHYLRALETFHLDPADVWAIGDSLAKDLEPAARLGIKTIWARYGATFNPSDPNMATLLRITHWEPSRIEATYKMEGFAPDLIVDSFEEVRTLFPDKYPTLF